MKYAKILSFIILLGASQGFAQNGSSNWDNIGAGYQRGPSPEALLKKADESKGESDYYAAMVYYQRVLAYDSSHLAALQGVGECANRYGAFENAEMAYQRLVDKNIGNENGEMTLRLAETKFRMGKFAEAQALYQKFLANKPASAPAESEQMAKKGLEDCVWADSVAYNTELRSPFAAVSPINTEYSDFAPLVVGDTLYYASYRFPFEQDKHSPKRHLVKVLAANLKSDTLARQTTEFNEPNRHTSQVAYNHDGSVMYYTICEFVNAADIRCDLYMRKRTGRAVWSAPIKLPEPVNKVGYTTTGPSVGYDAKTGQETLYFVSDRPGGPGKRDIWRTAVQPYGFATPVPLDTTINTKEDEVTPHYHAGSKTLYFSTNGRRSMGGYDIWASEEQKNGAWEAPRHMGIPINSGGDDAYLSVTQDGLTAYMASNRRKSNYSEGAKTLAEGACCFDIFRAELKKPPIKINLLASVFVHGTRTPINAADCRFVDLGPIGAKGGMVKSQTDNHPDDHRYTYVLEPNHRYRVIMLKPGFTLDSTEVSTAGITTSTDIERELFLRRGLDLLAHALDLRTKDTLDGVKFELKETGGEGRYDAFVNEKGQKYHSFLPAQRRYWLVASKLNYTSDSVEVSTYDLPTVAFQTLYKELKLRPRLEKFLPIKLYFDNDEPDKRTLAKETKQQYIDVYRAYIRRKQEFIAKYTEGMTGDQLKRESDSLDVFFERDVRQGWEKLMAFSEELYEMMDKGDTIVITLRGFASPRAGSEYNMNLTSRRVSSVWNHFDLFDGSIYRPFVESKQLTINFEPNGEKFSPKGINDNIKDEKNSVYSIPASKERRLEVVGVLVNRIRKL